MTEPEEPKPTKHRVPSAPGNTWLGKRQARDRKIAKGKPVGAIRRRGGKHGSLG